MIARELAAYPALITSFREARAEKAALLAQVDALLPAKHRGASGRSGLADKLVDAEMDEQMAVQQLVLQHVGAHLGIPWGTMRLLYEHATEQLPDARPECNAWGRCGCIEAEAEDAKSPTEDHAPAVIEPEWRLPGSEAL